MLAERKLTRVRAEREQQDSINQGGHDVGGHAMSLPVGGIYAGRIVDQSASVVAVVASWTARKLTTVLIASRILAN